MGSLPFGGARLSAWVVGDRVDDGAPLNDADVHFVDHLSDLWMPETRVHAVVARDEDEARVLIAERFPPEDGFIVKGVNPARF